MIGIITGIETTTNRDGDALRTMLQVEIAEGDSKTVELFTSSGNDTVPPIGSRVIVIDITDSYLVGIAISDDITPEVDEGEKELYSIDTTGLLKMGRLRFYKNGDVIINGTDGTTIMSFIKSLVDGTIVINGDTDFAVRFSELETAFNELQTKHNDLLAEYKLHTHPYLNVAAPATTSTTVSTQTDSVGDISLSKVDEVLLP